METISNRIKSLRKSEGLTQKEFAKRLLISQSYLSGLENNNEFPTDKLVKLICLEFGVNEDWLINGSGDMYDTVYENKRSELANVSNNALLNLLILLRTTSNVEYGFFAYSIDFIASMLHKCYLLDGTIKIDYLEKIHDLLMNLDRAIYVAFNNPSFPTLDSHKDVVLKDINQLFDCITKINQMQDNK